MVRNIEVIKSKNDSNFGFTKNGFKFQGKIFQINDKFSKFR